MLLWDSKATASSFGHLARTQRQEGPWASPLPRKCGAGVPAVTSQRRVTLLLHPTPQPLPAVSQQRKPPLSGNFLPDAFKIAGWLSPLSTRAFHHPFGRGPNQSCFPWGWNSAWWLPSFSSWVSALHHDGDFPAADEGEVKHPLGADRIFAGGWLSGPTCQGCRARTAPPWPPLLWFGGRRNRCSGMFSFRHSDFTPKR